MRRHCGAFDARDVPLMERVVLTILVVALIVAGVSGCGGGSEAAPPDATPSSDAGPGDDGAEDAGFDAGGTCLGASGCWSCPPTNEQELLDGCTDVGCLPFNNVTRLPRLSAGGELPPLP